MHELSKTLDFISDTKDRRRSLQQRPHYKHHKVYKNGIIIFHSDSRPELLKFMMREHPQGIKGLMAMKDNKYGYVDGDTLIFGTDGLNTRTLPDRYMTGLEKESGVKPEPKVEVISLPDDLFEI